jgi:hypothetical protein
MSKQLAFRILFLFLVFAPGTKAQYTSIDLTYGNTVFQKDFGGQLNTVNNYRHGRPMQYLGLMIGGMYTNGKKTRSSNFIMAQYLPQRFQLNDSVTGTISGSLFGLAFGFDCFPKTRAFDLFFSGGLNIGRLKLVQEQLSYFDYRRNTLHRKNMFISPKIGVMTKVFIWEFCITLNAEYNYDISGPRWHEKLLSVGKPRSVAVPGFNQSGFQFSIGLGYLVPMGSNGASGFHSAYRPWVEGPAEEVEDEDEEW